MKVITGILAVFIIAFAVLVYTALQDVKESGACTVTLQSCLNSCDKDSYIKGGACVVSCAFSNTACLIVSFVE